MVLFRGMGRRELAEALRILRRYECALLVAVQVVVGGLSLPVVARAVSVVPEIMDFVPFVNPWVAALAVLHFAWSLYAVGLGSLLIPLADGRRGLDPGFPFRHLRAVAFGASVSFLFAGLSLLPFVLDEIGLLSASAWFGDGPAQKLFRWLSGVAISFGWFVGLWVLLREVRRAAGLTPPPARLLRWPGPGIFALGLLVPSKVVSRLLPVPSVMSIEDFGSIARSPSWFLEAVLQGYILLGAHLWFLRVLLVRADARQPEGAAPPAVTPPDETSGTAGLFPPAG